MQKQMPLKWKYVGRNMTCGVIRRAENTDD